MERVTWISRACGGPSYLDQPGIRWAELPGLAGYPVERVTWINWVSRGPSYLDQLGIRWPGGRVAPRPGGSARAQEEVQSWGGENNNGRLRSMASSAQEGKPLRQLLSPLSTASVMLPKLPNWKIQLQLTTDCYGRSTVQ